MADKTEMQALLDELKGLDPSTTKPVLERPPVQVTEEATAAPIASGVAAYLGTRAGRSLLGEGATSLLELVLPSKVAKPLVESRRSFLNRIGLPETAPPVDSNRRLIQGAGSVVSSVSDPLSYIGPGGIARKAIEATTSAIGGDVGGEVGKGAGEVGQVVGGLVGGMAGANVAALPIAAGKAVYKGAKSLKGGELVAEASDNLANTYVANIFKHATVLDKDFPKKLNQAIIESGNVGVDLPIMSLVENPAITKAVDHLIATNADFRGAYKEQWDKAKAIVEKRNQSFFGSPIEAAQKKITSAIPAAEKAVGRKIESLDKAIRSVSEKYDINPDKQGLGMQLSTLIDKKHDEAIKAAAPEYTKAFDYAKQNNIELKAEDTQALYDFVSDEKNKDIFAKFPRLYQQVKEVFAPRDADSLSFDPVTKTLTPITAKKFSGQDIEVLDSLKRRVNSDLRKARGKEGEDLLEMFKERLHTAITNSSPEFQALYKAADDNYYKTVGIPYNSETAKAIDRAKYDEQVVPMITRNTSMLSDMLKATGDEGIPIAEAAFMDRFSRVVDPQNKGIIDPIKAQKWIKENQKALELLPDLKERLTSDTLSILDLQKSKDTLKLQFARAKANDIIGKEGITPKQLITQAMSDPDYLTSILTKYKGTSTLESIRSVALDDLMSYKSPMEAFNDKNKAGFYNRIFEGRLDNVKKLAEVSGRLSQFTPEEIAFRFKTAIPKDKFEEVTGVTSASAFSTLRSKVMGNIQKVFYLSSQIFNSRGAKNQEQHLAEALLNPKQIDKELQTMLKFAEGNELTVEEAKLLLKKAGGFVGDKAKSMARGGYVGAATQAIEANENQLDKEPQSLEEYLKELKAQ